MPFEPRQIANNFRLQPLIIQTVKEANDLLASKLESSLTSSELINLTLTYMESSEWEKVNYYAERYHQTIAEQHPSNEYKATILYVLAAEKRELNHCLEALTDCVKALKFAESDWLKCNLFRSMGLTHLKLKQYDKAKKYFQHAYDLVEQSNNNELQGLLPDLLSHIALSLALRLLARKDNIGSALEMFEKANQLYEKLFEEKGWLGRAQLEDSHNYLSLLFYRGMIMCKRGERTSDYHATTDDIEIAERLLTKSLKYHHKNRADDITLGDNYFWLARVYCRQKKAIKARETFQQAIDHYLIRLPENAKQIEDVKARIPQIKGLKPRFFLGAPESTDSSDNEESILQSKCTTM